MAGSHPPTVEAPSGAGATARTDQDARLPVLWTPVLPCLLRHRERAGKKGERTQVETEHGGGGEEGEEGGGGTPAPDHLASIIQWGTCTAKPVQRREERLQTVR